MAVTKKLIGFDDELLQAVEAYAKEREYSFTKAVKSLIHVGLIADLTGQDTPQPVEESEPNTPDMATINNIEKRIVILEEAFSWWNTDDAQSRLGNLEIETKDLDKRLNVLTSVSKFFKEHLKNRDIHMQD